MSAKTIIANVAAFAAISLSTLAADGWHTDFKKAKALAKAQNKDLLIEFTGSDWCPPCIALNKNVLSKEEFLSGAKKEFVLLKLDYPRKTALPEAEAKQNEMLAKRYGVDAYPTVLLADDSGFPYAAAERGGTDPISYLKMLKDLMPAKVEMNKALVDARKLYGKKKARALEKVVMDSGLKPSMAHETVLKEILAADPADDYGMATSIMIQAQMNEVVRKDQVLTAFRAYEKYLEKTGAEGAEKQKLMLSQVDVLYRVKDWHALRKMVDETIKIDPNSQIGKGLTGFKSRIDELEKAPN